MTESERQLAAMLLLMMIEDGPMARSSCDG
jgi:hypothetical protein